MYTITDCCASGRVCTIRKQMEISTFQFHSSFSISCFDWFCFVWPFYHFSEVCHSIFANLLFAVLKIFFSRQVSTFKNFPEALTCPCSNVQLSLFYLFWISQMKLSLKKPWSSFALRLSSTNCQGLKVHRYVLLELRCTLRSARLIVLLSYQKYSLSLVSLAMADSLKGWLVRQSASYRYSSYSLINFDGLKM